ncbi:hypothetical protein Y026_4870 [Burkholderia pseudomallei TSV28]|nr:hypothetical protein Y026_4870 [Burkholderia pseudomallei TSV28]
MSGHGQKERSCSNMVQRYLIFWCYVYFSRCNLIKEGC